MGQISYGTITITDTNDIENIYMEYAQSQSNQTAPTTGWDDDIPTWREGYYIWQRTVTKMSGVPLSQDSYGEPICLTGSTGSTGAPGQSVDSIVTTYCNYGTGTPVASYSGWQSTVPTYDSSKPNYWIKTVITYSNPTDTDTTIYKDNGITSATSTAAAANTAAQAASDKADDAWDKADNAESIAQQTSTNVTNLQTRTKYFWTNLVAHTKGNNGWTKPNYPIGTYAASGISGTTFDYENSSTYGYNTLYSNGIKLRYNAINLGELTGTSLIFYNPSTTSQGTKAMELSGSALKFYASDGLTAQAEFGGTKARVSGTIEALDGQIGNSTSNYWYIGNYVDYNQNQSAAIKSYGTAFIQLGDSNTWRLATNRFHSAWNDDSSDVAGQLHYPVYDNKYWDSGLHLPTSLTDKFLYIRNAPNTQSLENLQNDLEDSGYEYWTYQFYIDGAGNLHAGDIYSHGTLISGTSAPYLLKSGGTITGNLEVNGSLTKGGNNVAYLTATPTSGQILVADGTNGGIKTSGYTIAKSVPSGAIFTDQNVKTDLASNSTTFYIAGPTSTATTTGTLKVITDAKVTIDGSGKATITATTFSGNLSGTATKANQDGDGNVIKSTYLKLSGGNVTGVVSFGSSVSMNEATIGDLVVNGSASFTNNLQANTINGVAVGSSPKFTDTVTTVTTSGNGNAVTAITASNGKLTVTKGSTFLTSYTETDPVFVASVAYGITSEDISNWNSKTSNTGTVTKVTAGTGLAIGTTAQGSFTTSGTINHTNSVTAKTAAAQSAKTLTFGDTFTLYEEKYDAQGHITGVASYNMTMPANPNTHYTANLITGASATAKANAAASTNGNVYLNLIENDTVRNTHKIVGSGTTTVTSDADGVITISSADSKTGTVTSITLTQGTGISIGSSGTAITTSGTRTISLADNYGDTKNPYASKTARYVLAAPANAAGVPSFRALTNADVGLSNVLNATQITGIGQGENGTIRVYKGENTYEDVPVEIVATESSTVASAQKLSSYGGSNTQPVYFPSTGNNAGKPVAIGYTIETSVPSGAVFTDTTYTFANGTNGFTVTPLNGTAQTVTVTPSIANNITGSGTSGYLAKFNGANTITNGPALGTDTTKFLNNKGEWSVPTNTNTTYTLTNALASHKFTWTFTAGGSGSGSTTTIAELASGTGISLTDDANNKKITIGNTGVTGVKGNSESSYRTGQVNLTPTNLGAVRGNSYLFYGTCDTEAATAEKAVTCADFTSNDLQPGAVINVYFTVTNSAAVANLQLNVNGTGAKHIKYIYNGSYSNIPGANYIKLNQVYQFTYDGTYWVVQMIYNTNSDTSYSLYYSHPVAGPGGLQPYGLAMMLPDGRYSTFTTDGGNGTSKTKNTLGFVPGKIWYHWKSTLTAENAYPGDNCWCESKSLIDLRYSGNQGSTLTARKAVYLVGTIGTDGLFYLDNNWFTQTLPTSEDGKVYYYIGIPYDTYRVDLDAYNPLFKYVNGRLRQITLDVLTVNGHTVNSDVPSNAKFTDTWNALSTSQAGYVTKAPNDTGKFLRGDATWAAVTKANVGLGNVENTALSTWAGSSNITTVGTISTGTWSGSTIAVNKGGTGATTFSSGAALIGNGTGAIQTRSITNVTSGAVTANTNLVTANSLVAHVENKIAAAKDTYVTIGTDQTITASQKTFNGAIRWGTASEYGAIHYDTTLDALVFSFA